VFEGCCGQVVSPGSWRRDGQEVRDGVVRYIEVVEESRMLRWRVEIEGNIVKWGG
jgi:hypothetical protein